MPEKGRLTAKYEIATPMFIGDANQNARTVSPSSVKGALRFWWRALNWSKFRKNAKSDADALKELHRKEGALFGRESKMVDNKQLGGQGKFFLRVKIGNIQNKSAADLDQDPTYRLTSLNGRPNQSWQPYLLGLGLAKDNLYTRGAIVSGTFSVELYFRDKKITDDIKPVLLAWGLLGGLGSRNRKGLGSVNIISLNGENIPNDRNTYIQSLKQNIQPEFFQDELPPYTAFSNKAKVLVSPEHHDTAWDALDSIGETMQKFRGWGYKKSDGNHYLKGKVRASHNDHSHKQTDHDLIYNIANKSLPPNSYPKSIAFGLPKLYRLTHCGPNGNQTKNIKIEPEAKKDADKNNKRSRRASPLFIHIHRFDQKVLIVQVFLPATFIPSQDVILLQEEKDDSFIVKQTVSPDIPADWVVIDEYLEQSKFNGWEVDL